MKPNHSPTQNTRAGQVAMLLDYKAGDISSITAQVDHDPMRPAGPPAMEDRSLAQSALSRATAASPLIDLLSISVVVLHDTRRSPYPRLSPLTGSIAPTVTHLSVPRNPPTSRTMNGNEWQKRTERHPCHSRLLTPVKPYDPLCFSSNPITHTSSLILGHRRRPLGWNQKFKNANTRAWNP